MPPFFLVRIYMLKVKNDAKRLKREFRELRTKNRPLALLLVDLYRYVQNKHNKDITITMLYRKQEEQDSIYKHHPKYHIKPWKSPHQFWHGVDIRSMNFTRVEIVDIEQYLDNKYNKPNYYKWTAKCHIVSAGAEHFHIQFYPSS